MGIVNMGVPEEIVLQLAKLNHSSIFIETGTYQGGTTRWAAKHFDTVHTIERAESIFNAHSSELAQLRGVTPHLGDSRDLLPNIIDGLNDQTAVHWLDGHWSGLDTAGKGDECPIKEELACLFNRSDDIILIDDARCFLCAPPKPHDPSQWPTMGEIVSALPSGEQQPFIQVVDDVIFIIPNKPDLKNALIEYCQIRTSQFWANYANMQQQNSQLAKPSGLKRIFSNKNRRAAK